MSNTVTAPPDYLLRLGESQKVFRLIDIFDLNNHLAAVLVAAIFGRTPGLRFSRLQQNAEPYKVEIKTSEALRGVRSA